MTDNTPFRLVVELSATNPPVGQLRLAVTASDDRTSDDHTTNDQTTNDHTTSANQLVGSDELGFNGWMELLSALEQAMARPTTRLS
jgi:hypothetical protein